LERKKYKNERGDSIRISTCLCCLSSFNKADFINYQLEESSQAGKIIYENNLRVNYLAFLKNSSEARKNLGCNLEKEI
jgi:hypothetical protein